VQDAGEGKLNDELKLKLKNKVEKISQSQKMIKVSSTSKFETSFSANSTTSAGENDTDTTIIGPWVTVEKRDETENVKPTEESKLKGSQFEEELEDDTENLRNFKVTEKMLNSINDTKFEAIGGRESLNKIEITDSPTIGFKKRKRVDNTNIRMRGSLKK